MNLRFSRTPRVITIFLALVFMAAIFTPVNFVILQPGNGTALFPKVLTVKSSAAKTYKPNGEIYLLAIWVSTPDAKVLGAEALGCWARADCVVFPRSVIYKRNTSSKAEEVQSKKEMKVSQSDALTAAKNLLARRYPTIDTSRLSDSSITVKLPDTGGPSGGLIFSLGIAEKIIAAKKAGASILFASRSNCDEIPKDVQDISVIAISNLNQAIDYLQQPLSPRSAGVTGCTNLGS